MPFAPRRSRIGRNSMDDSVVPRSVFDEVKKDFLIRLAKMEERAMKAEEALVAANKRADRWMEQASKWQIKYEHLRLGGA